MTDQCGAPHHTYPQTLCTEPPGHYRRDRDPHAGPLIIDGRECGAAAWDEPKDNTMTDRPDLHDRLVDVFKDADVALPANQRGTLADIALDALSSELDTLDRYENTIAWHTTCTSCARILDSSIQETERAERAEAALNQVSALYEQWVHAGPPPLGASMARWWDSRLAELRAALQQDGEQPAPAGHRYLSTGCLHGDHTLTDGRTGHQYCQSATGKTGDKQPAQCKFCGAPCVCGCHDQPAPAVPAAPEPVDWRRVLDGFESLLKAFPADLHPGGPAVSCRPQPAQLIARWRDTARAARAQLAADRCCGKPPGATCVHDTAPATGQTTKEK